MITEKPFEEVCLLDALRALGFAVNYFADGPFWALRDGNQFLKPFGCLVRKTTLGHCFAKRLAPVF